jgi:hypothetical protein
MMNFSRPTDVKTYSQVIAAIEESPALLRTTTSTNQMSNTHGGLFVFFLFFSYICVGLCYKKRREARSLALQEQIKTLERIWNLTEFEQ